MRGNSPDFQERMPGEERGRVPIGAHPQQDKVEGRHSLLAEDSLELSRVGGGRLLGSEGGIHRVDALPWDADLAEEHLVACLEVGVVVLERNLPATPTMISRVPAPAAPREIHGGHVQCQSLGRWRVRTTRSSAKKMCQVE